MMAALKKAGKPVPEYLNLLSKELTSTTETAVFAMHCFWTGEVRFGQLDGVLATRPGFLGGHEVVEVTYEPSVLPYSRLVNIAQQQQCASKVFTRNTNQQATAKKLVGARAEENRGTVRPDREPKYQLLRTPLQFLPMTMAQQTKVNATLRSGKNYKQYLSPRQLLMLEQINDHPRHGWSMAISKPVEGAWTNFESKLASAQ